MGHRHERKINDNGWLFPAKKGSRVAVSFRGHDVRIAPFQGRFLRFEGAGEIPVKSFFPWETAPEGWFELWPMEPMLASSREEAKALFEPILPQVEDGTIDESFEKRPYQPPAKPQFVKEIEHLTHLAKARIVKHENGVYQIGYAVYAPNGRYLPVSTPSVSTDRDFEWGVPYVRDEEGRPLQTMADDPTSAEEIAIIELDQFVAQDPDIKRR